jgi:ferrous iron transport protein A
MTTLDSLKEGEKAIIVDINGDDAVAVRLMEMGLTEGEGVEVIGFAPMGDPIEFLIRGYRVSLRSSEAQRVQIENLDSH